MKIYPNYKNIDQLWLPEIPKEWQTIKIKYAFGERSEKGYPNEPLLVCSQNMGVVPKNLYGNRTVEAQKDLHLLKLVRFGDFVISLRSFQGGIEYAYYQGIISPAYTIMISRNILTSGYFKYLAKSYAFIELLKTCVTGIREGQNIDYSKLKNHRIPIPSCSEQDQIVRFLDWKISSINKLINIKRRKVKELDALKRAIISSTVTRGLTSNAPMKFSGVKWLGDIPVHWQISRIKRHFILRDERNDKNLSDVNLLSVFSSVGVIPRSEVGDYSSGNKAANADGYKIVHCGDIVVNIILCWMGALGKSDFDGVTSPAYDVYKPDEAVSSKYYHYLFRTKAFTEECYKAGRGIMSMRWRVYSQQFMNINIPIPPNDEQQKIVDYLDGKCTQIDNAITQTEESITALQELKKCLISNVVTGKIDVRSIEIPECEFVDEASSDKDVDEIPEEQEELENE